MELTKERMLETKKNIGIIRDSVEGRNKYCRIPIRRRRTPIFSYELEEILEKYQFNTEKMKKDAALLFLEGEHEEAGLLCSAVDFIALFDRIVFIREEDEAALEKMGGGEGMEE